MTGLVMILGAACGGVPLSVDPSGPHELTVTVAGDEAALTTTGSDPYVRLRPFAAGAVGPAQAVLSFEYFCPQGVDSLTVYYGPPGRPWRAVPAGGLPPAEGWVPFAANLADLSEGGWTPRSNVLRIDPGRRPGVSLKLRKIELRRPTPRETADADERAAVRERRRGRGEEVLAYLAAAFPAEVTAVEVEARTVVVRGRTDLDAELIEVRPWVGSARTLPLSDGAAVAGLSPGEFEVRLGRDAGAMDRLLSRFAVAVRDGGRWRLRSHARYATAIAAAHDLDRKTPRSVKGLGGVTDRGDLADLDELGIDNATINVDVNRFLHDRPGAGRTPFSFAGRTWYGDDRSLAAYDRVVGHLTDRGIVVSAIILVRFGRRDLDARLRHPAARPEGVYAMPDVDSEDGVAAYGAAVSLLADRYARPGDPHGRVSNWILHNEVDYGRQWTNMGEQPMPAFLDAYARSMRLTHHLARAGNPHARVFISLTHNWDRPANPTWRTYAPKRMLETLAAMGRAEGDFAWGVAYHPYPQSLLRPTPWGDAAPTDGFDTRYVTPKNIGVLCRWMETPAMRTAGGRVRGVLLSEQGYHTPDYSEASQKTQAAALLYTWDRLAGCDCVEAFHYHRWIDAADEGGLKLGLRTLPAPGRPYGDWKLGFETYRDLGTPRQEDWRPTLDEVMTGRR